MSPSSPSVSDVFLARALTHFPLSDIGCSWLFACFELFAFASHARVFLPVVCPSAWRDFLWSMGHKSCLGGIFPSRVHVPPVAPTNPFLSMPVTHYPLRRLTKRVPAFLLRPSEDPVCPSHVKLFAPPFGKFFPRDKLRPPRRRASWFLFAAKRPFLSQFLVFLRWRVVWSPPCVFFLGHSIPLLAVVLHRLVAVLTQNPFSLFPFDGSPGVDHCDRFRSVRRYGSAATFLFFFLR